MTLTITNEEAAALAQILDVAIRASGYSQITANALRIAQIVAEAQKADTEKAE